VLKDEFVHLKGIGKSMGRMITSQIVLSLSAKVRSLWANRIFFFLLLNLGQTFTYGIYKICESGGKPVGSP
jgi:hypothetical protein